MSDNKTPRPPENAIEAAKYLRQNLPWTVPNDKSTLSLGYFTDGEPTLFNITPRMNLVLGTLDCIIAGRISQGSARTFDVI